MRLIFAASAVIIALALAHAAPPAAAAGTVLRVPSNTPPFSGRLMLHRPARRSWWRPARTMNVCR